MTGLTLALDGSTRSASAALLRERTILADFQIPLPVPVIEDSAGRGDSLVLLISNMLGENGLRADGIGTVICGAGPGSFTSLRIAAAVAKGIAFAAGAKMYAVSSLLLTVAGMSEPLEDGEYLSVLPAMRGELFALPVSVREGMPSASSPFPPVILAEDAVRAAAAEMKARVIGPEQEIAAHPHARGSAALLTSILASGPIELDSWEPDYGRLAEAQVKWEAAHGRPLRA